MTSVLKRFAENPNSIQTAILSGGNGSNDTTQLAIATIDSRYGNVFIIDVTSLVPSNTLDKTVFVRLRKATVNAAGASPGKTITIVIKLPPSDPPNASVLANIEILFDPNFIEGEAISTSNSFGTRQSFTLVSDGVIFSVSGVTNAWGYA